MHKHLTPVHTDPLLYCVPSRHVTDATCANGTTTLTGEQTGSEHTGGAGVTLDSGMHLSSRRELEHNPTGPLWPKGLRGPLLPLRIEVGWIRLPSANKKKYSFKLDQRTKFTRIFGFCRYFIFCCKLNYWKNVWLLFSTLEYKIAWSQVLITVLI